MLLMEGLANQGGWEDDTASPVAMPAAFELCAQLVFQQNPELPSLPDVREALPLLHTVTSNTAAAHLHHMHSSACVPHAVLL